MRREKSEQLSAKSNLGAVSFRFRVYGFGHYPQILRFRGACWYGGALVVGIIGFLSTGSAKV